MAGNRKLFDEAMKAGSTFAWERQWEQAVAAYRQALAEFPDNVAALAGLGLALSEAGQIEEAADAYRRAAAQDREDPTLPKRLADLLTRLDRPQDAANAFVEAAERYSRRQAPQLAMECWEAAVRSHPACIPAHIRLLQTYLSQKETPKAVREYLTLADIYRAAGNREKALELCQYALRLDPHHPDVLAAMDHLRYGEPDREPLPGTGPLGEEEEPDEARGSPVELSLQQALSDLAETVFSETPPRTGPLVLRPVPKPTIDGLITRALDAQTHGDFEEAISCYEQVLKAGVIQPAVNFNLGLLYQQQLRFEEAIAQFQESLNDPKYRLGSHFALGECYRARGRIDEALTHFMEVLKIVDLATVQRDQADDLIHLYEELTRAYAAKGEQERAAEFINSLIDFLGSKGWEDKVAQARERLDGVDHEGPVVSLAEIFTVADSERILESLGIAQDCLRRGMVDAAMDELERAIIRDPAHLPTHRQMGEVLLKMGRVDDAVVKFLTIADVYRARGNFFRAAAMYERALSLAPMNVVVRSKLIDLLVSHGEVDRALEQYLALGDTYYQLAQLDRAREKYGEALRLAPRGNPEHRWEVRILHRIADIDMQRVDWRRAQGIYEQIRNLAPDDEKARLTLMDLHYRMGQPARAMLELDGLLKALRESGKVQKVIPILQGLVQERPDDIPLRTRLAQACLDAHNVEEALLHLDTLGDLLLQAGRTQEAVNTIRLILRLNPPNAAAYRELLEQLTGG